MIFMPKKEYNLTLKDSFWMLCIVLIYGVLSFFNLGSMENPQSFWGPEENNARIVVDLGDQVHVSKIRHYSGARFGKFKLYTSEDNVGYEFLSDLEQKRVFAWEDLEIDADIRYLAIEAEAPYGIIGEIALYNEAGQVLPVTALEGAEAVVDEAKVVPGEISYLNSTYFDEIYHGRTAYEFVHGMDIYEWTHPQLGKLIMSIPIKYLGMNPFAYRLMGNVAGLLMLLVIYVFAKRLFGYTKYAALAMILFAADGMHFVQTRIGTVDSFLVLFILLSYLFMYQYISCKTEGSLGKKLLQLFGSGIFLGMAMATKWNGAYAAIGLAVIFFVDLFIRSKSATTYGNWRSQSKKIVLSCFIFFGVVPITIYVVSFIPYYLISGKDSFVQFLCNEQVRMYEYHSQLNATHPFSSPWYFWPIGYKPVWYYDGQVAEGMVSSIALFSNPFIWWTGIVAMIYAVKEMILERSKQYSFLVAAILAVYVPYMLVPRIMYLYHYFPVVPLMILALVGLIKTLDEASKKPIYLWYGIIAVLVFAFCYPIYSGFLIPERYAEWISLGGMWHIY